MKSLILYIQFFTRIPIPLAIEEPEKEMRNGVKFFSFFGLLIGAVEGMIFYGTAAVFPLPLAWLFTLLADVMLTGAFHLDALADMADGLFSSRNTEKMLAIMKDSRIGSNGVLALIFYYAILIATIFSFQTQLTIHSMLLLVVSLSLVGKSAIALLFFHMTYAGASTNGLGRIFTEVKTADILFSQFFTVVALFLFFQWRGVLSYFLVVLVTFFYRKIVYQKVGGLNGDTLGAASPISQIVFVVAICCLV